MDHPDAVVGPIRRMMKLGGGLGETETWKGTRRRSSSVKLGENDCRADRKVCSGDDQRRWGGERRSWATRGGAGTETSRWEKGPKSKGATKDI